MKSNLQNRRTLNKFSVLIACPHYFLRFTYLDLGKSYEIDNPGGVPR